MLEDIFKPASTADLENRNAEYYKTPDAIELKRALDVADEAIKHYDWIFEDEFSAGHARDSKNMVEFNIKMSSVNVPDEVLDKAEKLGVREQLDQYFWEELPDQLKFFVEWLQEDFPFIEDYYQEGRMGGWLLLKLAPPVNYYEDDLNGIRQDFENLNMDVRDIKPAIREVKNTTKQLEKRIKEIYRIARRVENGRKSLSKEMSSPKYWERFFENYAEAVNI